MLIWLTAIVLMALFGLIGYWKGAIRMTVSFIGLVFAATLAVPLGPKFKPLLALCGVQQPLLMWLLPPVVVFALISLIFIIGSLLVHRQVALYYKYRTDDYTRQAWERLNQRLGVGLGLGAGAVYSFILGLLVYMAGYLTYQVGSTDSGHAFVRYVNQARIGLKETGLERAAAAFDLAPPYYYDAADVVGLLYHNPVLDTRLATYPPLLSLGERAEFQELAKDTQFNELWKSQGDFVEMYRHPKVQAVVNNQEILNQLLDLDLKDLREYLETGKSSKFEDEKILGRWHVDPYATLMREKRDLPSSEMNKLRKLVTTVLPGISLVATADNKLAWKVELNDQARQLLQATLNPVTPQAPAIDPAVAAEAAQQAQANARMMARYGRTASGGPVAAAPVPVAPATPVAARPTPPNPIANLVLPAQGTWKRVGDKYEIKLQDEKGKSDTVLAQVDDTRILLTKDTHTLVFVK